MPVLKKPAASLDDAASRASVGDKRDGDEGSIVGDGSTKVTKPKDGGASKAFAFLERFEPGHVFTKDDHNNVRSILDTLERQGKDAHAAYKQVSKNPEERDKFWMELKADPKACHLASKDKRSIEVARHAKKR